MAGSRWHGRPDLDPRKPWVPPGWKQPDRPNDDVRIAQEHNEKMQRGRVHKSFAEYAQEAAEMKKIRSEMKLAFPEDKPEKPEQPLVRPPNPHLMTDAQLIALVKELDRADRYDWVTNARPEQIQPINYRTWLLMAGRGFGKTRTGAETVRQWAYENPGCRIAVIAKGARELRDVCFAGDAGLLSVFPPREVADYKKALGDTSIVLTNGTQIIGYSAESPDAIRGQSFYAIWGDEFAAWPRHLAQDMLDQLWPCLRSSDNPRVVLTTTPKRVPHVQKMVLEAETDRDIVITKGKSSDNKKLTKVAMDQLYKMFAGTHQGRQELDGEMLDDVDGALWTPDTVEFAAWPKGEELPKFRKVIVAVDPSGSATGDETGIVVVAYTHDKKIFVLGCYSRKGLAAERYNAVCRAASRWKANEILYEANFSGDNAALGIENQWKFLAERDLVTGAMPKIKASTLKGDKAVKASPVAAMYEQQMNIGVEKIFHVRPTKGNGISMLESELMTWAVTDKKSPNSLDALVIGARRAMRELGFEQGGPGTAGPGRRIEGGWNPF